MATTLKQWLDSNPCRHAPAGFLCLPEVGPGVQVALRRLSLGEFRHIVAQEKAEGDPLDKLARVLPLCVCNDDGSDWTGPDLVAALPFSAATRIVNECLKANTVDVADAKKESPKIP